MSRTVNRPPMSVYTPSERDIKQHFFNQYNWKGVNDDKNFLQVDQESFQACDNIYVNADGLLRSRPSLKIKTIVKGQTILEDVTDVWTFGDVTVYETFIEGKYNLTFVNNKFTNVIQHTFDNNKYKLVLADRKIFIFTETAFWYYDCDNNNFAMAERFIHIPVTKIFVNGIESKVNVEEPNLLTNSYLIKYIYDSIANNDDYTIFVGKDVTVTLDGIDYNIHFVQNNNLTFLNKYFTINSSNKADDYILSMGRAEGTPLVDFADNGSVILSSYTRDNYVYTWSFYYSTNNILFEKLPPINNVIAPGKITKDGYNAIVFCEDGPYIYSLVAYSYADNVIGKEFSNWTNLLEYIDKNTYYTYNLNLKANKYLPVAYIDGDFLNASNFTFSYYVDVTDYEYTSMYNITCFNNTLKKTTVFSKGVTNSPLSEPIVLNVSIPYVDGAVSTQYTEFRSGQMTTDAIKYNEGNVTVSFYITVYVYNTYTKYNFKGTVISTLPGIDNYDFNYDAVLLFDDYLIKGQIFDVTATNLNTKSETVDITFIPKSLIRDVVKINGVLPEVIDDSPICKMQLYDNTYNTVTVFTAKENRYYNRYLVSVTSEGSKLVLKTPANNNYNRYALSIHADICFDNNKVLFVDGIDGLIVRTIEPDKPTITVELASAGDYCCRISTVTKNIATQLGIYKYSDYTNTNIEYTYIPWVFLVEPICYNSIPYCAASDAIYSYNNKHIEITEKITLSNNYFVPDVASELTNFYFAKGIKLFISKNINKLDTGYEWYFPEINLQKFNYKITNLHPISNEIMAVFFEDEVRYVIYDNEGKAYRYYKSKMQVGCKYGSDILTSFDGKYTIFSTVRGLAAMSYQDFIASEEQSVTYLSDAIYDDYVAFSKDSIKLFKYGYWIIVYKQNSNKAFIFDMRNNSWWPITLLYNIRKVFKYNDEPEVLLNNKVYILNKTDVDYYDYDGKKHKIKWFIKSQKLYLKAVNYYKHITNMTFTSVHDKESLENNFANANELDFKLQVNNYRKRIDGNINKDDYTTVNYNVESVRTYVQRLNYSKVNEFEYLLSSNDENAIDIPLSLSSITIKYKIGTQVR